MSKFGLDFFISYRTRCLVLGLVTLLSGSPAYAQDEPPLKVGIVLGLSGPASFWSSYQKMGLELAKDELEASGKKIELHYEDSRTETSGAVTAAKNLIYVKKVDAIIGDIFGYITSAMIPIVTSAKIPLVTPAITSEECEKLSSPYLFTMASQIGASYDAFKTLLEKLSKQKQAAKVALLTFDDPAWGGAYRTIWKKAVTATGLTLVSDEIVSEMKPDFKSLWLRILKSKPDIILFAHEPASALKALRQYPYQGAFISANALEEVLVNKNAPSNTLEGALTITTVMSDSFIRAFQAKYSTVPLLEAHASYEALMVIAEASDKGPSIPDALRSIRREGVAGSVDLSQPCRGRQPQFIAKQIHDNALIDY